MPLSPAPERELLHTRQIRICGYRRTDGLFDIEAQLTDTKSYGFANHDRGYINPGEPLHGMWLRLTLTEAMEIVSCEASSDHTPYAICPTAAANFSRLAGLRIQPGFLRAAHARVAGVSGCTHLRELLQQIATTAFQTVKPARARQEILAEGGDKPGSDKLDARVTQKMGGPPAILNTCVAYSAGGPLVKRRWPHLYTGPDREDVAEAAD